MKNQQKYVILVCALVVLIMAVASGPVHAALLIGPTTGNGSFEDPVGAGWRWLDGSTQNLTDWTISGAAVNVQATGAENLNQFIYLDSQYGYPIVGTQVGAAATITQTFDTSVALAAGHQIEVSFYDGALSTGFGTTLTVNIGTETHLFTIDESSTASGDLTPWTLETFLYTPTSGSTTLSFTGDYYSQRYGPILDNVTVDEVIPVPEPATFALLLVGGGLMVWRRRNR